MSLRKKIIGSNSDAVFWAAALVLLIFFQGFVSAWAQASMASRTISPADVICSIHDNDARSADLPFKDPAQGCCSTLCQLACALGSGNIGASNGSFYIAAIPLNTYFPVISARGLLNYTKEIPRLRGPPAYSDR